MKEIHLHADFLRGLARALLREFHAADDAVQEAYLEAVRRGRFGRSWLAVVVRNKALNMLRARGRRAERERARARPGWSPSAADVAAEAELHRKIAAAVASLEEPYRAAILDRYHHGLAPRAIARRRGEPVATIKTRLRRALHLLRARLDAAHGGDTRAWALGLVPLAAGGGAAAALVAAGILLAAGTSVFLAAGDGTAPRERSGKAVAASVPELPAVEPLPPEGGIMRWPVHPGPAGVPASGSVIRFRQDYIRSTFGAEGVEGRMVGETLEVEERHEDVHTLIAIAPDGSLARVSWDRTQGSYPPVVFRPARTVRVTVRERGGGPLAGVPIRLQGGAAPLGIVRTNEEGVALFGSLYGETEDVLLEQDDAAGVGYLWIGAVDLLHGDGAVSAVIEPLEPFVLQILPKMPDLEIESLHAHRAVLVDRRVDGEGAVHFRARRLGRDLPLRVTLEASGFSARTVDVRESPMVVELSAGAALFGDLVPPLDSEVAIVLERSDGKRYSVLASGKRIEADGLEAGRYRVVELRSGLVSAEYVLAAGQRVEMAPFDVSRAAWVTGSVVPPPGGSCTVVVHWPGMTGPGPFPPGFVQGDGSFRVRVPGDREVTLSLDSRTHVAEAVRVVSGPDGVVLHARETSPVFLTLELPAKEDLRAVRTAPTAWYFPGGFGSEHPLPRPCTFDPATGQVEIRGLPPGRCAIALDVQGYAPVLVDDCEVVAGVNDLGRVPATRGTVVRIRVLHPEGQSAPRLLVLASTPGPPAYVRHLNSTGEGVVELPGLGAGRFRVTAQPRNAIPERYGLDTKIEADGETPVDLTLDLR